MEEIKEQETLNVFLYHEDFPKGKIFKLQSEYDAAIENGWVEAPWLVVKKEHEKQVLDIEHNGKIVEVVKKRGRPPKEV